MNDDKSLAKFMLWPLLFMTLLVFISPYLSQNSSLVGLDGTVGLIDNDDIWSGLDPISHLTYLLGDYLCHQIEYRSFMLNGNQMPICARDLGILMGFLLGSIVVAFSEHRLTSIQSIILILPMALDGTLQLMGLYESINLVRLTTGLLAGLGAFIFMNGLLWHEFETEKDGG